MRDDSEKCSAKDLIELGPDLGEGVRPYVRHRSDHSIDTGFCHPVEDGKPIGVDTELVSHHGPGAVYEAKNLYGERTGPAKVNSKSFKTGWENIFGAKTTVGEA